MQQLTEALLDYAKATVRDPAEQLRAGGGGEIRTGGGGEIRTGGGGEIRTGGGGE